MTINADCNNNTNKLEVSVTSNGLEVTSAASAIAAEAAETLAERTVLADASSSSGTSSRSASTSPPPQNTTSVVTSNTNHHRRASPNKRTAAVASSNSATTKSPTKSTTIVQRHQSMPPVATAGDHHVLQQVVVGKQPNSLNTMAPSRPISMTQNHHHHHHHHHPTVNANILPPLDNCDSIFAIVNLPAAANSRTGEVSAAAAVANGVVNTHHKIQSSKSPPLPPLVKDRQQRKSLSTPSPPPPPPPPAIIDWKSQLNYELTMYQQMLANQSHRSPLLRTANSGRPNSGGSANPKQQQQQHQQPSSHPSSEQHHQHHYHTNHYSHQQHQQPLNSHHPNHSHPHPHPRQQTPNSNNSKPVITNGHHHHQQSKVPSQSSGSSSSNRHHPRRSTSPVKSPTSTTTTSTTVASNGSTADLTLDDVFTGGAGGGESRQLSPTTTTATNTTSPSSTAATANTSYSSPPMRGAATNSSQMTSPAGRKGGQPAASSFSSSTVNSRPSSSGNRGAGLNGEAAAAVVRTMATPYERLLYAMEHDKTWAKEVAFGRRIGLYRFKGDIGNGNFSQVKIAIHSLTKEKVAVKILDKARLDAKTQRMLAREIRTMETLHHPNLIRIFEVIETLSKHYIVMELAPGGELFQVISLQGRLSEAEGRFYFLQILSAIEHMHQHNLIHRDIKAENVFFSDPYTVKVGDFGFSTRISSQDELLSTFCGSPPYAAPELFRDESYRGPFVDYWALGVLLYFIVTGTMPFRAQTIVALKKLILDGRYDVPAYVSVECCQLIAGFLQPVPAKRYNFETAKSTRWLRGRNGTVSALSLGKNGGNGSRGSVAKYDLKTSYGRLLRSRRLAAAERRNTLSEFSTAEYDFSGVGGGSKGPRSNRFSLVEPTTTTTTPNRRSSPTESEKVSPPSSGGGAEKGSNNNTTTSSLTQPSTPAAAAVTTKVLSDEERQTFRQLLTLGIDDTVIVQHLERGSISAIVGTFRIVLHRATMEAAAAAAAAAKSAAQASENSRGKAAETANSLSRGSSANGQLGRSTSIQVAAFDRFWANYARKASAGTQGKTSVIPNNPQSKQANKKQQQQQLSITTSGPRPATVRQTIRSQQQQQQPPHSKTEHPKTTVVTVVDKSSAGAKRTDPSLDSERRSETDGSNGTPKNSSSSAAATVKQRNSSSTSKFSKMMAAMVMNASSSKQNQGVKGVVTAPSSANGRLVNGGVTAAAVATGKTAGVMTITENGGFSAHDGNDQHFAFGAKVGKAPGREVEKSVTVSVEPEVLREERQKVSRQKSSSSSSSSKGDSRLNDGATLVTVTENDGTTVLNEGKQLPANGHLPTAAANNNNLLQPTHQPSHHLTSANSGRLSRSWRTIKSLVTDSTICGTNIPPITPGAKSLPYNGGGGGGHEQRASPTSATSANSRASTPSSSSSTSAKTAPHHVLHKTTTLQIAVPAAAAAAASPNSTGASTALLWSPLAGKGGMSVNGKTAGLLSSPLRRSQTTPNVSTCYRNHLLNSHSTFSASSSTHKKYSATNGRCTIF